MSVVQGFRHDPGLPSGFVPHTGLFSLPLLPSVELPVFCLSKKQSSAARSVLEALVKEEGCILEKQMFKAAALFGVTQLLGLGFANKKAAKLSVSMKPVNSPTASSATDIEIFHQLQGALCYGKG